MLFAWSAFLSHTSAASRFAFLFLLIAVSHFYVECQQVPISQNKVSICADEYKVSSYTLECQVGLGIVIRGAIEVFARQSTGVFPDCFAQGYNYNYSKPFLDYCDAKNICTLSSAFLDENRLFDPEPYYLPDKSFYLKPFRIDVFYDCSNINSITTSSLSPVLTTTRIENLGGDNTTTDRTVMIVLIVLGAIFFLIIIAIVVLICLRRRNQKRMDKEFGGFRSEKNGGGASSLNNNASSASISNMGGGGVKEKVPFTITDTAFIEVSQSTSVRNYENSTETHGTYRSRNNNGYDSTADEPNSMSRVRLTTATISAETSLPRQPQQQQQVVNSGPKNRPRVDHDEYWRTNI